MMRPKTIGVFAGLLTEEGKVRLQRRIEKDSIIPGKSYEGDWELPGGRVQEKDIKKVLTRSVLEGELIQRVKAELGINIMMVPNSPLYLAIFEDPGKEICDWAFMITVPPGVPYWDERARVQRTTIDVGPKELRELASKPKGEQLLSGWGKRMCRMSLGALLNSENPDYRNFTHDYLDEINPNWYKDEFFETIPFCLAELRRKLGIK
ncbi:MAG: NUDIX hydrolase [bacterium]|nr:NUDIX hydrolase [bacterium]